MFSPRTSTLSRPRLLGCRCLQSARCQVARPVLLLPVMASLLPSSSLSSAVRKQSSSLSLNLTSTQTTLSTRRFSTIPVTFSYGGQSQLRMASIFPVTRLHTASYASREKKIANMSQETFYNLPPDLLSPTLRFLLSSREPSWQSSLVDLRLPQRDTRIPPPRLRRRKHKLHLCS